MFRFLGFTAARDLLIDVFVAGCDVDLGAMGPSDICVFDLVGFEREGSTTSAISLPREDVDWASAAITSRVSLDLPARSSSKPDLDYRCPHPARPGDAADAWKIVTGRLRPEMSRRLRLVWAG